MQSRFCWRWGGGAEDGKYVAPAKKIRKINKAIVEEIQKKIIATFPP
jgi:hypothetical protein